MLDRPAAGKQKAGRYVVGRRRERGWFAVPIPASSAEELSPETAHSAVSLRGGSGEEVMIVDASDGRLLGTIDAARATSQVHPGAVYLHQGETYMVEDLLLDDAVALARAGGTIPSRAGLAGSGEKPKTPFGQPENRPPTALQSL